LLPRAFASKFGHVIDTPLTPPALDTPPGKRAVSSLAWR
jgi:hypothetical protein